MQVNQVSLINYKILHQSLGGFRATQKLLVNSSNILPIAFLLLPSVAQSQTVDNFYREQQINNLTDQFYPKNMVNQPLDLSKSLLLKLGENHPQNDETYPGLNSAAMRFEAMASGSIPVHLFGTTTELVDAENITGGLPKLWVSAYDINYQINLEPEFWQTGAEVIKAFAAQVKADSSDEFIEDSGIYRSLIIGATLNNQLNLLPTEAQKQYNSEFSLDLPENLPENYQADAGLSPEEHNLAHDLFTGFFLDFPGVIESDNLTIYAEILEGKEMMFSLNNVFGNSETFSPAIPVRDPLSRIASALLIDSSMPPEILLSEGFRDILNPQNISVNPVNYQTLIAPEFPYVYDGDENLKVAAIKADDPVSDGAVSEPSEINDPWQEIPANVNLTAWSGLPPEFSPDSRDSAKVKNGANRPPLNQKSEKKFASLSASIVLDQIADPRPRQDTQRNTRSWSGLPPEFSPASGDLNPVNQQNQAYLDRHLSWQDARISASWGNYEQGTLGNQSFSASEPIEDSNSFSNSPINLDPVAESFPDSSITRTGEIAEFAPSELSEIAGNSAQIDLFDLPSTSLTSPSPVALVLPTVPPLSLPIAEGMKSAQSLSRFFTPVVPSFGAEFSNQTQRENNSGNNSENNSENNPENNSYTIQAKVLDSPVSYLIDRQSWSEAYSSLINRDLQNSLEAIALTTNSTPGVVYVLAFSDYLELMLLSPGQPTIRRIVHHANRDLLNATVQELVADVTNPRTLGSESASAPLRERYLSSAQQLYQWLISPIERELGDRGIDTLMFSLDPNIRSLPIAVLHDGQQFLVEKYRLSLIPSLNLTDLSYQNLAHSGVLAMGASEFADPRIQPLDQVPLELSAIAQNRPGQVHINEAFTPENLKYQSDRGNYQIIHLATHVEFNPENTQNSYIQFWNRRLTLHEIQEIGWQNQPLELLVMSGCETAFGSPNAELGFAGLAVKNGVKSVLASLWQVDDQGTFGLMSEFYRHLNSQSQTIKAEALRQAQLAMLQGKIHLENGQLTWVDDNPQTYSQSLVGEIGLNHQQENISSQTPPENPERKNLAHPYFWAAFTLVGNPW